jgi:hypothetical protein
MRRLPTSTSLRSRRGVASIVICLALALAFTTSSAEAGDRRVTIGEVSSQVVRTGVDYESILRAASEEELRSVDLSHVPRGKRVIVSVALVRLDTLGEPPAFDTTCEVSATLRDAKGGAVFAILEGKARAKSGGASGAVESSAVHGALHGALGRIPEALRR